MGDILRDESPVADLAQLVAWYAERRSGTREHRYGVSIQSTDNPGWWVKVYLVDTPLATRAFAETREGINGDGHPAGVRWLRCYIENQIWNGAGDETRLPEIVQRFNAWARSES